MNKNFLLKMLATLTVAVVTTGCPGRECTVNSECAGKGEGWFCSGGACKPPSAACTPACSGTTPLCDASTKSCKTCTATAGCSGSTPVCDVSASGGAGACVACLTDAQCSGATPACNPATKTCVTCTATTGCSGATPVCDTTVAGGQCVGCLADAQCSGATPACDPATKTCVGCLSDAQCSGATPACNPATKTCVTCTATTGCSGATPVCDTTVTGGQCKVCLANNSGCAGSTPVCDVSVGGGQGQCVECLNNSTCTSGTAPYCNVTTKTCKFCLANHTGCSGGTPYCDTTTNGGLGTCEVCTPAVGCAPPTGTCRVDLTPRECLGCGADTDCNALPATPYCDVPNGTCVECTDNAHCSAPTALCDTASFECKACLADHTGCSAPTPVCDVTGGGGDGACVTCTPFAGCAPPTPACDVTPPGGQCVECLDDSVCSGATPLCDTAVQACRVCLADDRGCSGATPHCDVSGGGGLGACYECVTNAHCAPTQDCNLTTHACEAPATPPATTSGQIAAVRASDNGTLPIPLDIPGALVTYKRVLVGSEAAGFFIQAEQAGPAIFVAVDPDTLTPVPQVGDRVDMRVLSVGTTFGSKQITALESLSILNSGHPIAPLAQDVSAATDLVSNLVGYESEMLRINSATVSSPFTAAGSGFVSAQISSTGYPFGDANVRLRIPDALRTSMLVEQNCVVTLNVGPMWRYNAQVQPSAYGSELSATCPARVVQGAAALDVTHVNVGFSQQIDPSSVLADGSQFTATGGLVIAAAVASGSAVTLTTSAQTAGTTYSVSVAGTVTDMSGAPVVTPNSVDLTGFSPGVPSGLKLNEVDYDQPGSDVGEFIELYNNGTSAVSLANLAVVLVNGSNSTEYARFRLAAAVDADTGGNPVTSIPAGGYLVIASDAVEVPPGIARIRFSVAADNIQNGAPDGIALVNTSSFAVLDALSYEGSITAANIGGFPVNLVEGTAFAGADDTFTPSLSLIRNPNGADTNNAATDWALTNTLTVGTANVP